MGRKREVLGAIDNIDLVRPKCSVQPNVWADGERNGELKIGQRSLFWWGKSCHKSERLNWSKLAEKMNEPACG
jgi:hypothetical protein